jgi:hypothetical protein
MQRIDQLVLEKLIAPVAGWLTHRLGLDQWRMAIECLNGHLVFYLAGTALTIGQGVRSGPVYPVMIGALAWLLLMQAIRHMALRQASSSLGVQTARMAEWHIRTILVLALPFMVVNVRDLGSACYTIALALLGGHFYFKACDVPPPQERRERRLAYNRFPGA